MPAMQMPRLEQAAITAATTLGTVMGLPSLATASAIKDYKDLTATQRLATTPLYFVCNSRGNAFLQDDVQAGNPEQKIVVYFMSSEDANGYLDEMSQVNSQSSNEFRVMSVSMEKIVNQIQSKKQSRKLGRYDIDLVYRIQPSSRQCENAEKVAGKGNPEAGAKAMEVIFLLLLLLKSLFTSFTLLNLFFTFFFTYQLFLLSSQLFLLSSSLSSSLLNYFSWYLFLRIHASTQIVDLFHVSTHVVYVFLNFSSLITSRAWLSPCSPPRDSRSSAPAGRW